MWLAVAFWHMLFACCVMPHVVGCWTCVCDVACIVHVRNRHVAYIAC